MAYDRFLAAYPEFATLAPAKIVDALATAERRIDPAVWGDLADEGHGLQTASDLASGPYGQDVRLADPNVTTTWDRRLRALREAVACGLRLF